MHSKRNYKLDVSTSQRLLSIRKIHTLTSCENSTTVTKHARVARLMVQVAIGGDMEGRGHLRSIPGMYHLF